MLIPLRWGGRKHPRRRGWENSRQLCKPSTSSRVCITVSNSPSSSRVYIRSCKHGNVARLLQATLFLTAFEEKSKAIYERNSKSHAKYITFTAPAAHTLTKDSHTLGTSCPTVFEQCVGSLTSYIERMNKKVFVRQDLRYIVLIREELKSNHMRMKLQGKHFLLCYLKTLSNWARDLLHSSPMLTQLSHRFLYTYIL